MPSTNTSKPDKTVKDDIEQEDDTEQADEEKQEMKNKEQEDEEADSSEEGYTLVETTSSVPEFMGTDLEAYGPFDEGEEVKIPDDNAEILVNRGNAERIET